MRYQYQGPVTALVVGTRWQVVVTGQQVELADSAYVTRLIERGFLVPV